MKVCPLRRISNPAPEICPNVLLTGKSSTYVDRTHGHFGIQHPSAILGVYDQSLECESLAS